MPTCTAATSVEEGMEVEDELEGRTVCVMEGEFCVGGGSDGLTTPEKRQGSCREGVRPMSLRAAVNILYQ